MKEYKTLHALLKKEHKAQGRQVPDSRTVDILEKFIAHECPTATHLVYFCNGQWTLLPVGPDEKVKTPGDAENALIPPRHPVAFCKITRR